MQINSYKIANSMTSHGIHHMHQFKVEARPGYLVHLTPTSNHIIYRPKLFYTGKRKLWTAMFHHVPIILQVFPQAFNQPFASARVPNQAASLEVSSWTGSMEHPEIKRSFSDQFWTILGMIPQISPHYIIYYIYSILFYILYAYIYIIHCIYI